MILCYKNLQRIIILKKILYLLEETFNYKLAYTKIWQKIIFFSF